LKREKWFSVGCTMSSQFFCGWLMYLGSPAAPLISGVVNQVLALLLLLC
jgi:hypothetical protein